MDENLLINGRFFAQPLSGVQRFATEITNALRKNHPDKIRVLAPPSSNQSAKFTEVVGRHEGHIWEQLDLPWLKPAGHLINLGNTAPLTLSDQTVVIHDAGIFSTPRAYNWKFRIFYKHLQRHLAKKNLNVVTVSNFSRNEISRHLNIEKRNIKVISEGSDHMLNIDKDERILARIPPGRFAVVVGNLSEHKNLSVLSHLAASLAARGVHLVITGSLTGRVFNRDTRERLPQPALYLGRVTDESLKALYESAACLVFPSVYEGFGLPAIEAMACKCPVVLSRIPTFMEICGSAAVYADPADPTSFTHQVFRLLDESCFNGAIRHAGYEKAKLLTWSRAAEQLMESIINWKQECGSLKKNTPKGANK